MAASVAGPIKMWLETPDGRLVELEGGHVELTTQVTPLPPSVFPHQGYLTRGRMETSLEATFTGEVRWMSREAFLQELAERRRAKEYFCSWCGQINDIENKNCSHCGGARDFLLD